MQLSDLRTVFMGTPACAVPALDALVEHRPPSSAEAPADLRVIGIVTQPDTPSGRHRQVQKSAVAKRADELGIPVFTPKGLKKEENRAFLADLKPDLIVVVAYGKLLPKEVLDLPRFGAVNVHFSLLPRWRGPAPVPAAVLAGDADTGVSIMKIDEGMDTGPLLAQERVPIASEDTTATLLPRLAEIGARLLSATLPRCLSGEISPAPQDAAATVCPMLKKEDGLIDWAQSVEQIARMVRAYDPWPRAYTWWGERRLIIRRATPVAQTLGASLSANSGSLRAAPGMVVHAEGTTLVATGGAFLQLGDVQLEGRRPQSAEQFVRGYPAFVGSVLGKDGIRLGAVAENLRAGSVRRDPSSALPPQDDR